MIDQIKDQANRLLRQDDRYREWIWIHSAVAVGASVLVMLLNEVINNITPGGGIRNMNLHSLLATIQVVVQLAVSIGLIFWNVGLINGALCFTKNQSVELSSFMEGFRRFGPVLICRLFRTLYLFAGWMLGSFLGAFAVSFLPMPGFVMRDVEAFDLEGFMENPIYDFPTGIWVLFGCYLAVSLIIAALLTIPKLYSLRLSEYCLFTIPNAGIRSPSISRMMMRKNRMELFRLDLSFWWYYLADLIITLLPVAGLLITFPGMAIEVSSVLFSFGALALRIVLYGLAKPKISACYALFYLKIHEGFKAAFPQPPQNPGNTFT